MGPLLIDGDQGADTAVILVIHLLPPCST
jgi:hypothetical protein